MNPHKHPARESKGKEGGFHFQAPYGHIWGHPFLLRASSDFVYLSSGAPEGPPNEDPSKSRLRVSFAVLLPISP